MKLRAVAQNPIESILKRLNVVPVPLLETQMAFTLSRVVMAATKLGVFDALAAGPLPAARVADECDTSRIGTEKLLFALAGAGYLDASDGEYALTPVSRKWLVTASSHSLADKMLFQFLEWDWLARTEDYVRTGDPLDVHTAMTADADWDLYQRGMRAMASTPARELVRRLELPRGARAMLDIGGSHGYYSVALCRKHKRLRSVILDLPEAVAQAAPILAAEGMGDRVVHRAGDALTADLGEDAYDLVLVSGLVHHFSDEQNRELAGRVSRALRPGGVLAVQDIFRPSTPKQAGQIGALLEFYFALTSQSGTWSIEDMTRWQQEANLQPRKPIRYRTVPGTGIQAAVKPR
ncbi:methyltransferase [Rhodococcus sp. NPDC003382]